MVGWLAKKAQNSRVYMCIKEVKWTLESADAIQRAMILALAQLLRGQMVKESNFPLQVLNRPLDYDRDELMQAYDGFEDIRNQNNQLLETTKKNMRRFGANLPQFSIDHAVNVGKSVEFWMSTLGAGVCPERRDDVREIWSYLASSYSHLPEAIVALRKVEELTAEMTGSEDYEMFDLIDEDWLRFCRFFPEAFSRELRLD